MTVSFVSLQQDISTHQLQVTGITITNQAQSKEIKSLSTTVQYLSTEIRVENSPSLLNNLTD